MNWIQWIGDLLRMPSSLTVAGNPSHWHMRRVLRMHGVTVRRIRTERAAGVPFWNRWDKQAEVIVGRYQDILAADILREHGFDVRTPAPGAEHEHVPPHYAARLRAIEQQRQQLTQPPTVTPQVQPWQRPVMMPGYGARQVYRRVW